MLQLKPESQRRNRQNIRSFRIKRKCIDGFTGCGEGECSGYCGAPGCGGEEACWDVVGNLGYEGLVLYFRVGVREEGELTG